MYIEGFVITSSRLMLHVSFYKTALSHDLDWRTFVWDWKTGDIVMVLWLE